MGEVWVMKINNPFKWLREKISKILDKADLFLYENIDEAIMVANAVKRLVNLPATTIIVSITPTDMDNRLAVAINKTLDEVLLLLKLADKCQDKDNYQQRLRCFVEEVRLAHPDMQAAIYMKVASLFLHKRINSATEKYTPVSTCDTMVQVKYWESKNMGK